MELYTNSADIEKECCLNELADLLSTGEIEKNRFNNYLGDIMSKETKRVNIEFKLETHKRLKLYSIYKNESMTTIINKIVGGFFDGIPDFTKEMFNKLGEQK